MFGNSLGTIFTIINTHHNDFWLLFLFLPAAPRADGLKGLMFASLTLSEEVESHSMQPPASEDRRLCLGIIRGGEDTWGMRGELTWPR